VLRIAAVAAVCLAGAHDVQAQDLLPADPARGAEVWAKCKACHTLAANGPHIVGPSLHDLFGRKAGTQTGYAYSPAMRESGVVWNEDTLDKYLAATTDFLPGTKMYGGLTIKQDRLDLIAWLKTATRP
jgi:cytochrome c